MLSFTSPPRRALLCSGRPNCGATQSFGEKLCLSLRSSAQTRTLRRDCSSCCGLVNHQCWVWSRTWELILPVHVGGGLLPAMLVFKRQWAGAASWADLKSPSTRKGPRWLPLRSSLLLLLATKGKACPEKDESFEGGGRSTLRQVLLWFPGLNL